MGEIDVPGYAATIVAITFFGSLNTLGLGIVGIYAWRANENAKRRPPRSGASGKSIRLSDSPAPNKGRDAELRGDRLAGYIGLQKSSPNR